MNNPTKFTRNYDQSANIVDLKLVTTISDKFWAGTDDTIYLSMGHNGNMQPLKSGPKVGENITIDIDIPLLFGRPSIHISELDHISFYQLPTDHPIASDDWDLETLVLIANDIFTNKTFKKIDKWLSNSSSHLQQVWSGKISWSEWLNSDQRPIDLNTQTYPVRFLPWISDLKSWRTYDPSKIDGVGQLIGMFDGKLVGESLKTRQTEILQANGHNDSYTWVYTPEGSIIYRLWQHDSRADYVRHSQLGSGRPVICAGELRLENFNNEFGVTDIIGLVNDSSGHYMPDGGACLKYVDEKLRGLGIDTDHCEWRWRNTES